MSLPLQGKRVAEGALTIRGEEHKFLMDQVQEYGFPRLRLLEDVPGGFADRGRITLVNGCTDLSTANVIITAKLDRLVATEHVTTLQNLQTDPPLGSLDCVDSSGALFFDPAGVVCGYVKMEGQMEEHNEVIAAAFAYQLLLFLRLALAQPG